MAEETSARDVGERTLFAVSADVGFPPAARTSFAPAKTPDAVIPRPPGQRALGELRRWTGKASRVALRRSVQTAAATELDRGFVFLLAPVFMALGAIVYFSLPGEPGFGPLIAAVAIVSALLFLARNRPVVSLVMTVALLCILGMTAARFETWRAGTKIIGGEISTNITGHVVALEHLANRRVRMTIDLISTDRPKLRYAPTRIRASARTVAPGIRAGSEIAGLVRLMPPSGPVRPQSYDFSFESYFDGIGASGFFLRGPQLVDTPAELPLQIRFAAWIEDARNRIADRIRLRIGGAEGEIAAALVVGVRAGIPEDVNEALRRAGIYHVISISGLHMALVAGTIMAALRLIMALFAEFASRHPVKKYAAAAALAATAAYLFISGGEVAAERSFIMLAVMLVALLFDHAALTMRNLAISAIVVIALSPHEVAGPSFQMSFAATAALVGAYAFWSERRAARIAAPYSGGVSIAGMALRKSGLFIGGLAMTSIIAGIATTIFAAYHFQRIAPLSLGTNLAAMPIVSIFVMPFAVMAAIAMPFGLDGPFLDVMGKGLTAMIAIAEWFSERSPVDAVGLVSARSVVLFTIALVIATVTTTWLRLLAVPFAVVGVMTMGVAPPDVLISEDGRLVAVPIGDGRVAINRDRANQFTIDNWQRALGADTTIKPERAKILADEPAELLGNPGGAPFRCDEEGLCLATHPSGAVVAFAANEDAARWVCAFAALIVIDDATAKNPCRGDPVRVVTKRDLARFGSASVIFSRAGGLADAGAPHAEIQYAIQWPYRPWETQRRFSREARGLAPYRSKKAGPGDTAE